MQNWKDAMSNLNLVEATALQKLVEKVIKKAKDGGEEIDVGAHSFNVDLNVEGTLSKGMDSSVAPTFKIENFLKAIMLKYASTLGKQEGKEWLNSLLSIKGAMGAVIKFGPETVVDTLPSDLIAAWDIATEAAKQHFHAVSEKVTRSGNTVVVGNLSIANKAAKKKK